LRHYTSAPQFVARLTLVCIELNLQPLQISDSDLQVKSFTNQRVPADGRKGIGKGGEAQHICRWSIFQALAQPLAAFKIGP